MTGTRRICILVVLIVILIPLGASAQLGGTQYAEYATVSVGQLTETVHGPNIHLGDNITASVGSASASIGFDSATTPDWMTAAVSIAASGTSASAQANGTIDFKFTLNTISNPPVTIPAVPVSVTASGHAGASITGFNGSVDARAELTLIGDAQVSVALAANALQPGATSEDAFGETVGFQMTPTEIVSVSMWAQVTVNLYSELPGPMDGEGNAYIDPIFTVSNELIPGTSTRYDEVYEVRFSTGWDDSTGGTPISTTQSVGRIKTRFGN